MGVQVGKHNGADKYEDKTCNGKIFVELEGFCFFMWVGYHRFVLKFEFPAAVTVGKIESILFRQGHAGNNCFDVIIRKIQARTEKKRFIVVFADKIV